MDETEAGQETGVTRFQRFTVERIPRTALRRAPYNPRQISAENRKRLAQGVSAHGLVETLVWNRRTGHLVSGHQRLAVLDALEGTVEYALDVAVVDVDEREERILNVQLNNGDMMGRWDAEALEVLRFEHGFSAEDLGFDPLQPLPGAERAARPNYRDDHAAEREAVLAQLIQGPRMLTKPDTLPSSNRWGIPDYRVDAIPTQGYPRFTGDRESQRVEGERHLCIWGYITAEPPMQHGCLAWYCWEHQYPRLWDDLPVITASLLAQQWGQVIEPDFSIWWQDAFPVQLWSFYRNRFIARYWQDVGLAVVPNLPLGGPLIETVVLDTLPPALPAAAIQCRTLSGSQKAQEAVRVGLTRVLSACRVDTLIVYGGVEHQRWLRDWLPDLVREVIWLSGFVRARTKAGLVPARRRRHAGAARRTQPMDAAEAPDDERPVDE